VTATTGLLRSSGESWRRQSQTSGRSVPGCNMRKTPEDRSALKSLDLSLGYPEGGQIPLILTGWEERSVWGFDPHDDAYFAQLCRNGSPSERPDVWICGRGRVNGREFVVTTTRLLAQEVAEATGPLSHVCRAMIRGHHRISSDTSEPDDR
jgi:hypothetical protein